MEPQQLFCKFAAMEAEVRNVCDCMSFCCQKLLSCELRSWTEVTRGEPFCPLCRHHEFLGQAGMFLEVLRAQESLPCENLNDEGVRPWGNTYIPTYVALAAGT